MANFSEDIQRSYHGKFTCFLVHNTKISRLVSNKFQNDENANNTAGTAKTKSSSALSCIQRTYQSEQMVANR